MEEFLSKCVNLKELELNLAYNKIQNILTLPRFLDKNLELTKL